jgi:iron-sulfur cluster repair protein YtfE (RIC family)
MQAVNNIKLNLSEDVSDLELGKLMKFIGSEFHEYFQENLPQIDTLLHACVKVDQPEVPTIQNIYNAYVAFRNILEQHIGEEQHIMIPFVKNIIKNKNIDGIKPDTLDKVFKNIEQEHEHIKNKLNVLENLTENFKHQTNTSPTLKNAYNQLAKLKHNYLVYSFIEMNYLYPKLNELKNIY